MILHTQFNNINFFYQFILMSNNTPASNQSLRFQHKRFQEGMTNQLTSTSKQVLRETDQSSQEQIVSGLKQQYNDTLAEYNGLLTKTTENATNYFNRISPKNPYINKTVRFTTGEIAYVTNHGVVKYIPSNEIRDSIGTGISKNFVQLDIPWDRTYLIPETQIPTTPPLVSGTPMKKGQSVGNEGTNVYVDRLVSNSNATYQGCFADNTAKPSMTFLSGAIPSTVSSIINGDFSQPIIGKNTYQYINSVIAGWNFNAVLLNESVDWGFPIPYPNGHQCACLQNEQSISQTLILSNGSYKLSFVACGRNCCDNSNTSNPIDVLLNNEVIYKVDTPVNAWTTFETMVNIVTTGNNTITFRGTWAATDRSTAIQSVSIDVDGSRTSGSYTYDDCKLAAIDGGYKFFSLQNVNYTSGKGFCAVSNNDVAAKRDGNSYIMSNGIPLWASNTSGQTGNTATLTNDGGLAILNSTGASSFSTPTKEPVNYMGCYADKSSRTMEMPEGDGHNYNRNTCQQLSQDKGYKYYGLQDSITGENAQCELSNDLNNIKKYGIATNCTQLADGSWSGGSYSNAVYTMDPDELANYFLILQDDGNMCIYRGSGPNDNQGVIWASGTTSKQKEPNLNFAATKGKFGKNWISAGAALVSGDFIGSNNGAIYLVMQTDGNLVLYTSERLLNCNKMPDNNMGGGVGANALYKLDEMGFVGNLSKVGYVNPNADVYQYPNDNIAPGNVFVEHLGYDSVGHDIEGASYGNATLDKCKTSCLDDATCAGFAFTPENNVCYPKNEMAGKTINSSSNLYIRTKQPKTLPKGISSKINNVDSIKYQNYVSNSNAIDGSYGVNSVQQQQLEQTKAKMDLLSNQLIGAADKYSSGSGTVNQKIASNIKAVEGFTNNGFLTQLKNTRKKIDEMAKNDNNIVRNSDIVVLQQNYEYVLWSILAIGTILITMKVIRN